MLSAGLFLSQHPSVLLFTSRIPLHPISHAHSGFARGVLQYRQISSEPLHNPTHSKHQPQQPKHQSPRPPPLSLSKDDASIRSLIYHYNTLDDYTKGPVWSFSDLEPNNPPQQKSLRGVLRAKEVEDLQFLRWRNALLPCSDYGSALESLAYRLLPTPSIFSRRNFAAARRHSEDKAGTGPSQIDEFGFKKIAASTPAWIIHDLIVQKLTSPVHIPSAISLIRPYNLISPQNQILRDAIIHITLFAIINSVHSVVPSLLHSVRHNLDHEPSEEDKTAVLNTLLLALVRGPLVTSSVSALPDRSLNLSVQQPKLRKAGPRTRVTTFSTYNEIGRILQYMTARGLRLDRETFAILLHPQPALPSALVRMIMNSPCEAVNSDHASPSSPNDTSKYETGLWALARSLAREGRSYEAGRILDRIRKSRLRGKVGSKVRTDLVQKPKRPLSRPPPIPMSAAFDKRISSQLIPTMQPSQTPAVEIKAVSSREKLTTMNSLFLYAFRRDKRSRDDRKIPHAVVSYFRKLQVLHDTVQKTSEKDHIQGDEGMIILWNTFLATMAAQQGFPTSKFLVMLDTAFNRSQTTGLPIQMPTITACINGLVQRGEYEAAILVWKKFIVSSSINGTNSSGLPDQTLQLDWVAVTAAGRALLESGRVGEAWELFNQASRSLELVSSKIRANSGTLLRNPPSLGSPTPPPSLEEPSASLASTADSTMTSCTRADAGHDAAEGRLKFLTTFMRTLAHRRRPDIIYALWDTMERHYSVRPNNHTLNTLLVTASSFSKPSQAVSLSQQMGWRSSIFRHRSPEEIDLEGSPSQEHIKASLLDKERASRRDVGFWWHDKPAWQIARLIFRDVVLGNWPELASLDPPVIAHPDGFHPLIDLPYLRTTLRPKSAYVSTGSQKHSLLDNEGVTGYDNYTIPHITVGRYYDIIPDQRSFDAYMQLLCAHDLASEIPETLMWQRELGILPSHRSLRLAFVHFSAVGTSAPFDEAVLLKHGAADSPYGQLKRWVKEWVPEGYMPSEKDIERERRIWGTEKNHWARQELAKDMNRRRAKWRRSRKDLRKAPGEAWKAHTRAMLDKEHRSDDAPIPDRITVW